MIDIVIPVYNKDLLVDNDFSRKDFNFIFVDDSEDQSLDINFGTVIKNGSNKGSLLSRITGILNTTSSRITTLDCDDFINYDDVITANNMITSDLSYIRMSAAMCNESTLPYEDFINKRFIKDLPRTKDLVTGAMIDGDVARDSFRQLLSSNLIWDQMEFCGGNITYQDDWYMHKWMLYWLYNHHKGHADTWLISRYYDNYSRGREYIDNEKSKSDDFEKLTLSQRDHWISMLDNYWNVVYTI